MPIGRMSCSERPEYIQSRYAGLNMGIRSDVISIVEIIDKLVSTDLPIYGKSDRNYGDTE